MTSFAFLPQVKQRIDAWLSGPYDPATKEEISALLHKDPKALNDAFYSALSFGTGGIRALMGVGTCKLNIYTIRQATEGLARYLIKEKGEKNLSVVVGFDSRHNSKEFALETARVLAAHKIKVYLLTELRPTPFISFACRFKKADAAIMITASHNPANYNGYKVYWSDGAQIVSPHDVGITKEVEAITELASIKTTELSDPLIEKVDSTLDADYLRAIHPLQHYPKENSTQGSSLKIVYTSLHGTGITLVPQALASWGFTNLDLVSSQVEPDGNFPTTPFPNPENADTLRLGIEKLQAVQGDLLIATDPDADRLGIAVIHEGNAVRLTGNEMAALCVAYLCETLKKQKTLPAKGAFITTIVTTELLKTIAKAYDIPCFEVLTGFKYIGEMIHKWETSPEGYSFIFGAEESYGCLIGTHARDKDAIVASCLIAEMALQSKMQGKTLIDSLHALYAIYGLYCEKQLSIEFPPGKEGMEQMRSLMENLRTTPPKQVAHLAVVSIDDYLEGESFIPSLKTKHPLHLPSSDVLAFRLSDNARLIIRPSGTEPKIKIYASVSTKTYASLEEGMATCEARLGEILSALKHDLSRQRT